MSPSGKLLDWSEIAVRYDIWMPQLQPTTLELIKSLQLSDRQKVLDIASGTGEPALSIAEQDHIGTRIIATDASYGMLAHAQYKAKDKKLSNINFLCTQAQNLCLREAYFDRISCRFGFMLFPHPQQAIGEMLRVLKPGGRFAFTVWHTPESMPTLQWSYLAFKNHIPDAELPPLKMATSLGNQSKLTTLLSNFKNIDFQIDIKCFNYSFPDVHAYWQAIEESEFLKQQFCLVSHSQQKEIRDKILKYAEHYLTHQGLIIPHEYLLVQGSKKNNT